MDLLKFPSDHADRRRFHIKNLRDHALYIANQVCENLRDRRETKKKKLNLLISKPVNRGKMKKIIFVRHGRAEDQDSGINDFERSLTLKGKIISRQMAVRFREKENNPGLIISSPAFRALETALIFAEVLGISPDNIMLFSNFYNKSGIKVLFDLLPKIDDSFETITLFGHNPSFTEMPDRLCTEGCEFLTKTSIVCISFTAGRWSGIKVDTGKLEYFLKPEK